MSIIKEFVHNESFLALTIHLPELLTSFRIHIENYFRYLILTFGVYCCVQLDGQRAPPSFESDHSLLTPCLQLCEKQPCTISSSIYLHVLRTLGYTGPKCPKLNKMRQSALWTTKKIHILLLRAFTLYTHCDTLATPTLLPPQIHTITQKPMLQWLTLKEGQYNWQPFLCTAILARQLTFTDVTIIIWWITWEPRPFVCLLGVRQLILSSSQAWNVHTGKKELGGKFCIRIFTWCDLVWSWHKESCGVKVLPGSKGIALCLLVYNFLTHVPLILLGRLHMLLQEIPCGSPNIIY
jgi:hypothetical protein